MAGESTINPADTRTELFDRFVEAGRQMRQFLETTAASLGLTAPQAHALHLFSTPRPMRSAAEAMRCDASYITHIADDLESLGLARRSVDPTDRRVRQLTLTVKGRHLHRRLAEQLHRGNPLAINLDGTEQATMVDLLRKLPSRSDEA